MCGGPCPNHCALKLYADGVRALPSPPRARMHGFTTVALLHHTGDAAPPNRTLELVMPRGGHVELVGLRLSVARAPALEVRRPHWRPHAAFRWLAYGDSITQGFCADTPYPEIIGRENGWRDINAGISALPRPQGAGHGAQPLQGRPRDHLARDERLFVVVHEAAGSLPCDAGAKLATVLDEFRAVQPRVPIAVITPLTRRDEGHATCCVTLEGARQQLKAEVVKRQVRGDETSSSSTARRCSPPPRWMATASTRATMPPRVTSRSTSTPRAASRACAPVRRAVARAAAAARVGAHAARRGARLLRARPRFGPLAV